MKYRDPGRSLIGGRPAWAKADHLALPDLVIEIGEEAQTFDVRIMLARPNLTGHWVERRGLPLTEVARLLVAWHDGPEETCLTWFKEEPPDAMRWREEREKPRVSEVLVGAGDAEIPEGL